MQFRDLKTQYKHLKSEIDKAIADVLESASFIGGATVSRLERTLAEYVGVKYCISCANGTDALEIALTAMSIGKGDAVFVPDFTFFATAEAVVTVGATPVFVDVYEDTFNMSAESLEAAIKRSMSGGMYNPKAIIPVDLFGLPADYYKIKAVAKKYNLFVVEDGAQGFGGSIGEKKACSFGDIGTTSFFPAKPLGCYGDGGAIFTDNDEWAEIIRSLCVHGKGEDKYDNVRIGRNSRLDAVQAAILEVKFKSFVDYELEAVNKAAELYNKALENKVKIPVIPDGYCSSFAQYTVKLKNKEERDIIVKKLSNNGIPTMIYYPIPIHKQKAFSDFNIEDDDFPATIKLCDMVLSLPMHPYLNKNEIAQITEVIDNEL